MRRGRDEGSAWLSVAEACDEIVHLVRRQLTALAWLCALGKFDLQVFRRTQILNRHAEASRGDLLDGAILVGAESLRVLAALAGVGHETESVHCESYSLVSLWRNGS